jgi:hypothetical protein
MLWPGLEMAKSDCDGRSAFGMLREEHTGRLRLDVVQNEFVPQASTCYATFEEARIGRGHATV